MTQNIVLVGGPNSGKSNYLARLWVSLSKNEGRLLAPTPPDKIAYVEKLVQHLFQGRFAPRSDSSLDGAGNDLTVSIALRNSTPEVAATLVVPDVLGEIWKNAVEHSELPQRWHDLLASSNTALLFVRAHSEDNFEALDWVTASDLLANGLGDSKVVKEVPTQVALCELLRMFEGVLSRARGRPRVAVVVAAWDMLDPIERTSPPMCYLDGQFPLLAGRLRDALELDVRVFGLSIVGGNLKDDAFRQKLLEGGIVGNGYVVVEEMGQLAQSPDVTLPIQWLLGY